VSPRIVPSFDRFGREIDMAVRAFVANQRSAEIYFRRAAQAAMHERTAFWCASMAYLSRMPRGRSGREELGTARTDQPSRVTQQGSVS